VHWSELCLFPGDSVAIQKSCQNNQCKKVEKKCIVTINKPEAMNPKRVGDLMNNRCSKMHVQCHCQIDQSNEIKDTLSKVRCAICLKPTTAYDDKQLLLYHVS
jgi:hypothetical protein